MHKNKELSPLQNFETKLINSSTAYSTKEVS